MLTENARTVLERRYLIRDEEGRPLETPEQLFKRVADTIAARDREFDAKADVDKLSEEFRQMMESLYFLPNSPALMNAGRPLGQLSACFVLPVGDSMEEIFDAVKNAALIHKSGGGTGFSFSRLRPKGSSVNSTGGVASGPVSFMKVFNAATEAVKQGGMRRGANMGILRVDHPDILEFIDCKRDTSEITNFNISVGMTAEFMRAVIEDCNYDLIDPKNNKAVGQLSARETFDRIVDSAWLTGEPGIIFLDRLNEGNVTPALGEIESTNPCGEQPLLPYESCNLGSINLAAMVKDGGVDWDKLGDTAEKATHFLDNVIEANVFPLEEIERVTKMTRKVGLGVMGWADMLLELGIPYDSNEAIEMAEKVMGFIRERAQKESRRLAEIRGAFPAFAESTLKDLPPVRNATLTTIAPTGTLSIIAGVSSGVEPVFAYAYVRNVMDGTELIETNPVLEKVLKERGIYSDSIMREIAGKGSLAHIDGIPEDIKRVFVCAHDILPEWHIRMQAAFQKYTDNAVSKTVNFPNSATRDDVRSVYTLAYELGCKGVTIYRDGSRESQVLSVGTAGEKASAKTGETKKELIRPRPRPEITTGFTERVRIGCGNLYITVNYDEQGICEVFTNTGKYGGCPSQSEATARLATASLRSGVDPRYIIEQLKGIRCPSTIRQPGLKALSCPDAIATVLAKVLNLPSFTENGNGHTVENYKNGLDTSAGDEKSKNPVCPECGSALEHEGGCVTCRSCGYSKCG